MKTMIVDSFEAGIKDKYIRESIEERMELPTPLPPNKHKPQP
jgi:hypothetical protein